MTYLELEFTDAEKVLIDSAWLDGVLDWSSKSLMPIRSKIRTHHRLLQKDSCCYCRKDFADDHPLAVDIEHILPKSKYKGLAICRVNLSVACKRCNMQIKKDRQDFIIGGTDFSSEDEVSDSGRYSIIHPNLDVYADHIGVKFIKLEELLLRRYVKVDSSLKAQYTIEYFDLRSLEVDELDGLQGIEGIDGSERANLIRFLLGPRD
ncbi:hypothetical protein BA766_19295 [Stenotrophomonas maltophilia]|uniref:HNH endonuclease domain-containing protein n=1 Tax=Stenotrophomonas maltophilia TaxID=40324 RepID=UPI000810E875|nr:HNH endonuclease domain-containing protein [Stenotrophomonas maltophilia]OCK45304.1 hypothetical protein BA766_19295 [Stenotrophomonas maltophilia]